MLGVEADAGHAGDSAGAEEVVGCRAVELEFVLADCEVGDQDIVVTAGVGGVAVVVESTSSISKNKSINTRSTCERINFISSSGCNICSIEKVIACPAI